MSVDFFFVFFFQAEDGIRDLVRSRGLGDVYKRQMMELSVDLPHNEIEKIVLADERSARWMEGKTIRKLSLIHI